MVRFLIDPTMPWCILSYIRVISCTGAVCQRMGVRLYLLGVKCTVDLYVWRPWERGCAGLTARGQPEPCQLSASARPEGFGVLCICTLMSTQRHSDSAIAKIRKGLGLPPLKGPSVAETNRVFQSVCQTEYWLPGWTCMLGISLWWERTACRDDGELCLCSSAVVVFSLCAPAEPKRRFWFNWGLHLLKLELMLNSLQDLNHIFLFLIRMLDNDSLCFLAVCISLWYEELLAGEVTHSADAVERG